MTNKSKISSFVTKFHSEKEFHWKLLTSWIPFIVLMKIVDHLEFTEIVANGVEGSYHNKQTRNREELKLSREPWLWSEREEEEKQSKSKKKKQNKKTMKKKEKKRKNYVNSF